MSDDRIYGYADYFVQSNESHPMQDLARWLQEYSAGAKLIGVKLDTYYYSAKAH